MIKNIKAIGIFQGIILLIFTSVLFFLGVFSVHGASNSAEKVTYKMTQGQERYFVGYSNESLVKGQTYKYTITYEANVVEGIDYISGQNAKCGIFLPNSSGTEIDLSKVDVKEPLLEDVASPAFTSFSHTLTIKALEDVTVDVGVFLGSGTLMSQKPDDTLIWKNVLVTKENPTDPLRNTPPAITAYDKVIGLNEAYDPYADVDATDSEDGNLKSAMIILDSDVDVTKIGTYTTTYYVKDSGGLEATKTVQIKVIDRGGPPVYTPVINAFDKTLYLNDPFSPLEGVTSSCPLDGDITDKVIVTKNTVDTTKIGTYNVEYSVTNSTNQVATKEIVVTVVNKTIPNISGENNTSNGVEETSINGQLPETGNGSLIVISIITLAIGGLLLRFIRMKNQK